MSSSCRSLCCLKKPTTSSIHSLIDFKTLALVSLSLLNHSKKVASLISGSPVVFLGVCKFSLGLGHLSRVSPCLYSMTAGRGSRKTVLKRDGLNTVNWRRFLYWLLGVHHQVSTRGPRSAAASQVADPSTVNQMWWVITSSKRQQLCIFDHLELWLSRVIITTCDVHMPKEPNNHPNNRPLPTQKKNSSII